MAMITVRYTRLAVRSWGSGPPLNVHQRQPSILLNRALSFWFLFPCGGCFVALGISLREYIYSLLELPTSPQWTADPGTNPRHLNSSRHEQVTSTGLALNPTQCLRRHSA